MSQASIDDVVVREGRCVRVRRCAGDGTPLVLLHGFCDSSEGWGPLVEHLGRPAIAFDLPGFGGSDPPARPRISCYAETIDAALELLDVPRAIVVGHSLGGAVATSLAARHPRRVASLVLLAPAGFGWIPAAAFGQIGIIRRFAGVALPLVLSNALTCSATYALAVSHRRLPPRTLVERAAVDASHVTPGIVSALEALAVLNRPAKRFTGRRLPYDGPVAAVWGEHDVLVPTSHARAVRRALPQADTAIWKGIGHHPQVEAPELLAELIDRICERADSRFVTRRNRAAARIGRRISRGAVASPGLAELKTSA
jgi:pimeloyl-ACP methyl ester carboxylesterase